MADVEEYNKREEQEIIVKRAALLPPIEDSNEFLGRPIAKPPVLIEGLLKQKRIMVLGASSKIGKTWTLINLGISVASGAPWLGLNTTKGKVLYLNFELAEDEMQERIEAVKIARCITLENGQLDVWNLGEHSAPYNVILPAIYERIKTKEYAAIVLDPIYCMYGDLDENSAGDVSSLMNGLRKLSNKSKAAIVFAHHFSKGNQAGKESQDRISGSGVWGRAVDTNVSITAHEDDDAFTLEATPRGFKKIDSFVIKWEYPLMVRDDSLNPDKLKTAISKKPVYTVQDLVRVLAVENMTTKMLREAVLLNTGMSRSMFYELLKGLKDTTGVTVDEEKQLWSYQNPNGAALK
jgi:RecA-family ATPase